jgi:hypothetical protein
MQRDVAIAQILKQLGNRQTDATLQQYAIDEMVNEQNEAEHGTVLPWFLISLYDDATFVTVANQNYVSSPTGFLRELDDDPADIGALWWYDTTASGDPWTPIYKEEWSINTRKNTTGTPGKPNRYSLVGDKLYLFPTPDDAYLLRILANFADTSLSGTYGGSGATTENNWLLYAPKLLIARTGKILARNYLKDDASEKAFTTSEQEAWTTLLTHDTARREAAIMRAMGV